MGASEPRASTGGAWADFIAAPDLAALSSAWIGILAGRIPQLQLALLLVPDAQGVFRPQASWPPGAELGALGEVAQATLESRELVVLPAPQQALTRLGYPVEEQGVLIAAVVVELRALGNQEQALATREIHWASGWLRSVLRPRDAITPEASATAAGRNVLEALRVVQAARQSFDAALALANHLAHAFSALRVAVGLERGSAVRLLALSATPWFDPRSNEVARIENALEEAVEQRRPTVLPAPPGARAGVTVALAAALGEGRCGCVVVLGGVSALGSGALLVERPATLPFSQDELLLLEQIGVWAGPVLELHARNDRWFAGKGAHLWNGLRQRLGDRRRPALRIAIALGALALLAITLVPVQHTVTAQAVIEGRRELVLAAPFEGFIGAAHAKAGEIVRKGQVLAELDTRELLLEAEKRQSALTQAERRYVDAMAKHERSAAGVALATMDEAAAQLALNRHRLERASLRADMDATVIVGDLSQQIGAPVKLGQTLFKLAPLGEYRVILRVDEQDVMLVRAAQTGTLVLSGEASRKMRFHVDNIAGAEARDGLNLFRVEARIDGQVVDVRPGMEGVGRIDAGTGPLARIWTRKAVNWLRLAWFRWLP